MQARSAIGVACSPARRHSNSLVVVGPMVHTVLLAAFLLLQSASARTSIGIDGLHNLRAAAPPPRCPPDQLFWSNLCWYVRSESGGPCGDTCFNQFSPKLVAVDSSGVLKLRADKVEEQWHNSEVYLNQSLGHGTYTWVMETNPSLLDRNLVASSYIYADDTREFDVEFSGWGQAPAQQSNNAQFLVQPPPLFLMDNQLQYKMDSSRCSTHTLTWSPGLLTFTSSWIDTASAAPRTMSFEYSGTSAEWSPGDEALHLSLWMFQRQPPAPPPGAAAGAAPPPSATTLSLRCFGFCALGGGGCVGDLGCGL